MKIQNKNFLTEKKYADLKKQAEEKAEIIVRKKYELKENESFFNCWKRNIEKGVYEAYLKRPCNKKEDLLQIAGMAYSWMPTMLEFYYKEDNELDLLLKQIHKLEKANREERIELIKKLSLLINHSIVGASKTLHIIYPDLVPLTDSRVARSWNIFFATEIKNKQIEKLPTAWHWKLGDETQHNKKVNSYIHYWDTLDEWKDSLSSKVSLRDLELRFYLLGEPDKKKK